MSVRSDQETLLLRGETVSESKHQQQQQRRLMEVTVLYGRVGVPTDRFTGRARRLQLLQLRYLPISRQPTDNTRPVNKWPLGSIFLIRRLELFFTHFRMAVRPNLATVL